MVDSLPKWTPVQGVPAASSTSCIRWPYSGWTATGYWYCWWYKTGAGTFIWSAGVVGPAEVFGVSVLSATLHVRSTSTRGNAGREKEREENTRCELLKILDENGNDEMENSNRLSPPVAVCGAEVAAICQLFSANKTKNKTKALHAPPSQPICGKQKGKRQRKPSSKSLIKKPVNWKSKWRNKEKRQIRKTGSRQKWKNQSSYIRVNFVFFFCFY